MSEYWQNNPENDDEKKPNPLREHLRKLEDENKDLKKRLSEQETQVRKNTISSVLKDKGYSPKVAALVPADVEPTAEAVEKWLADYGEVLKPLKAEESNEGEGQEDPEAQQQAEGMNRIAGATNAARSAGAVKNEELSKRIADPSLKKEDLLKMIHEAGGGFGLG